MGYEKVKVGEVASIRGGKRLPAGKDFATSVTAHPYIRARDIGGGKVEIHDPVFIDESTAQKLARYTVKKGDVCLTIVGANVGAMGVVPPSLDGANLTENAVKIVSNGRVDQVFLKYALLSEDAMAQMKVLAGGAAQPKLGIYKVETIEFPFPPLPIQQRIAGILSAYDELIENSQRRIKLLESIARALYREWFVHFRFPGHDNPAGQPDWTAAGRPAGASATDGASQSVPRVPSPLGDIPQGWEVKKLGDVAEEMRRNVQKGQLEEPRPFVGLEHIPRRSLALDAWETTTDLGSNKLAFRKGEILFGKIRPYFHKVSVAPFDGLCSADTIVIRSRQPEHFAIVAGCVSSDEFVALATATSNGSKMPRASWSVLQEHLIAIPTLTVAEQFSAVVQPAIQQMQALIFQIQNLRRTRDLLLPRLLSGQIEVETLPEGIAA